jgi:hypothetical protein
MDIVYPIGSIYQSMSVTSPASVIGGTWTKINTFLYGADTVGQTGGEKMHTLTIMEMPTHAHAQYVTANSGGGTWSQITNKVLRAAKDTSTGGSDTQTHDFNHNHYMSMNWAGRFAFAAINGVTGINIHNGNCVSTSSPILTSLSSIPSTSAKTPGANGNFSDIGKPLSTVTWNNLPACQNCYVWHRTA